MASLAGTTILVVGASGVLGGLIAERLEQEGATTVRTRSRGTGDPLAADLREPEAASAMITTATAVTGALDGVVIAAGVVAFGPAAELADETLDELFAVNAVGPMRVVRAALPALEASAAAGRNPFVLTISGVVSEAPTAHLAAYSASKAALAAFVLAAGRETRRSGIRLIDARPGHTETGLAWRAIAGTAPAFPAGLAPEAVAARIVRAIIDDERDLPSSAFSAPA